MNRIAMLTAFGVLLVVGAFLPIQPNRFVTGPPIIGSVIEAVVVRDGWSKAIMSGLGAYLIVRAIGTALAHRARQQHA